MRGRSGSRTRQNLGILIMGDRGTWKSSLGLESLKWKIPVVTTTKAGKTKKTYRPSRVLYIDIENGSIDSYLDAYEENGYNLDNIYIAYTQSMETVNELVNRVKNNEDFYQYDDDGNETDEIAIDSEGNPFRPDVIVIDGMALLYHSLEQAYLSFSEKRAKVKASKKENITSLEKAVMIDGADLEFKDYKKLKFDGNQLILDLVGSGKHFIVTAFSQEEKVEDPTGKRNKDGSVMRISTGNYLPEGFKDLVKYCKTVMYMFQDEEDMTIKGLIQHKDRSMTFKQGEIIDKPTLTAFQPALEKNLDKKLMVVSNNIDEEIKKDEKGHVSKIMNESDELPASFDTPKVSETKISVDETTTQDSDFYKSKISEAIKNAPLKGTKRKKIISAIVTNGLGQDYKNSDDVEKLKITWEAVQIIK